MKVNKDKHVLNDIIGLIIFWISFIIGFIIGISLK